MNQILKGEPMTIFGDGEQTRAFSYVKDVTPVIVRSVRCPKAYNEVFNIGADTPYTVNYLARCVAEAMGGQPDVVYLPARKEVVHAYSLHQKVKEYLGATPKYSLEEGLARMAAWVQQVGARSTPVFQNIEVPKNLPSVWLRE